MQPDEEVSMETPNVKIPSWVIYFVVLLFVISVFGFFYFHRYSKCIRDYKHAIASFQEGDLESSEKYITSAASLVPHNTDILSFYYYISGLREYNDQNYDVALEYFKKYKSYNSDDLFIDQLIATVEISFAFGEKDYNKMVELSAQLYDEFSEDPLCILQYASAIACVYATTENMDDYNKVQELIETARKYELDDSNLDYIKRIEYRLSTKNIISKAEYFQLEQEGKL